MAAAPKLLSDGTAISDEDFFRIYNGGKKKGREAAGDVRELEVKLRGEKVVLSLGDKAALKRILRALDKEYSQAVTEISRLRGLLAKLQPLGEELRRTRTDLQMQRFINDQVNKGKNPHVRVKIKRAA